MCGICGFYDRSGGVPRRSEELEAMGETIRHRGPDSHGSTLHNGVGLHCRRLRIIDLHGGDQPIFTADGQVVVVYNGEIFNFQELRRDLRGRGYQFRTRTDTEVLVHLYREFGPEQMLSRLNGFFAFALHDRRRGRLMLARDRLGVKPLHYAETPRGLVFGSEIKALLHDRALDAAIDPSAVVDYLCLRYVPAPKTIYREIRKLPAGHFLLYDGDNARVQRWWDLPPFGTRREAPEILAEELWELVLDSVRRRLTSDVPLGAFLSGGLDSSAVVTAMQRVQGHGVTALSIGFEDWDQSELEHSRVVAGHLGIRHVTDTLKPEVVSLIDSLAYFFDEPFADPSAIPTYLLAERARAEVTVALSGDGGDECFAGYRRYRLDRFENRLRAWFPGSLCRRAFAGLGRVYPKADFLPQPLRARATLQSLGQDPMRGYMQAVGHLPVPEVRALLHPDVRGQLGDYDPVELLRPWFERAPVTDPLSRIQYVDFHTYLPDYILCKVDRATMAHSLEAREPLLDYRLVELAATIPADYKLHRGIAKWIFKRAVEPHLPESTLKRAKQGFHPPLRRWMGEALGSRVASLPTPRWLDSRRLERCVRHHVHGLRDYSELLYSCLVLRAFEQGSAVPPTPQGSGARGQGSCDC